MSSGAHVWLASGAVMLPALVGGLLLAWPGATRAARVLGVGASLGSLVLLASLLVESAK